MNKWLVSWLFVLFGLGSVSAWMSVEFRSRAGLVPILAMYAMAFIGSSAWLVVLKKTGMNILWASLLADVVYAFAYLGTLLALRQTSVGPRQAIGFVLALSGLALLTPPDGS